MYHHLVKALPGTLLFRTDIEGAALWTRLVRTFPELIAACAMPDHVHMILPHADPGARFALATSAFARWRNAARGSSGPVWGDHPPPQAIPDAQHLRRTVRYVHLNPCRARLVADPLAWPFSSHADRVGFAIPGPIAVDANPGRFHAWVSADPTVCPEGTPLPFTQFRDFSWDDVVHAVCGVYRADASAAPRCGAVRRRCVEVAWAHHVADVRAIGAESGLGVARVRQLTRGVPLRGSDYADPTLSACVRAVGDPRFYALAVADRRRTPGWSRYRQLL